MTPIWKTAADQLRKTATALKEAHTVNGDWRGDQQAYAEHALLLENAAELERSCGAVRDHLMVLCDIVEEEEYCTREERIYNALAEIGLQHLAGNPTRNGFVVHQKEDVEFYGLTYEQNGEDTGTDYFWKEHEALAALHKWITTGEKTIGTFG